MSKITIEPSQLRVGMFIQLDISWIRHDFLSNDFKIKDEKQLAAVRSLGLKTISYDPSRSDIQPEASPENSAESQPKPSLEELQEQQRQEKEQQQKNVRILKLKERRVNLGRCEKAYANAVGSVRKVMGNLLSQPAVALEAADEMVGSMVDRLLSDQEATLQLVSIKGKNESSYYHSINVFILSLMLGKHLDLNDEQMRHLGIGALFHDLGHGQIPSKILRATQPLSNPELLLYQMHPSYGVKIAQRIGTLPAAVIDIIGQHHEMNDGSGYPHQLKGAQISQLAQIVAIVNSYDNLCNSMNSAKSCSPFEAMSYMYAKQKGRFDQKILSLFITHMGVYPPGTVIKLEDGRIATVISTNPQTLLRPNVMIYDPSVPATEAPIINLVEEPLKIIESIRRSAIPSEVLEYLNLGGNLNYFIDPAKSER